MKTFNGKPLHAIHRITKAISFEGFVKTPRTLFTPKNEIIVRVSSPVCNREKQYIGDHWLEPIIPGKFEYVWSVEVTYANGIERTHLFGEHSRSLDHNLYKRQAYDFYDLVCRKMAWQHYR